jgi:hypothetical protein
VCLCEADFVHVLCGFFVVVSVTWVDNLPSFARLSAAWLPFSRKLANRDDPALSVNSLIWSWIFFLFVFIFSFCESVGVSRDMDCAYLDPFSFASLEILWYFVKCRGKIASLVFSFFFFN